jgi:hypothetical protein
MLDGEQCSTLRVLLAGYAESVQLLQGRCQQIGQLLQEAASAPAHAAGVITLHREVGILAYSLCHYTRLAVHRDRCLLESAILLGFLNYTTRTNCIAAHHGVAVVCNCRSYYRQGRVGTVLAMNVGSVYARQCHAAEVSCFGRTCCNLSRCSTQLCQYDYLQ